MRMVRRLRRVPGLLGAGLAVALLAWVGIAAAQQREQAAVRLTTNPGQDVRPAWSPDGKRIAFQSNRTGAYQIWTVNRDGADERRVSRGEADDRHPAWSPDGRQIVFDAGDDRVREIWVMDPDGGNRRQITALRAFSSFPAWSPDGRTIAFFVYRDGAMDLWAVNADASAPRALTSGFADERKNNCTFACHAAAWSPESATLAFSGGDHRSVWTLRLEAPDPIRITSSEQLAHFPWFMPDGRLAYIEEHASSAEAWTEVRVIDPSGQRPPDTLLEKVLVQGPYELSPDGKRLVFHSPRSGNFDIYLADLTGAGALDVTQAQEAASPGRPPAGGELPTPDSPVDRGRALIYLALGIAGGLAAIGALQLYRRQARRR